MPDTSIAPEFRIWINGSELPPEAAADLLSVSVSEMTEAASTFELRLVTWDLDRLEMTWVDDDLFSEGNEVEVQMGYVDNLETLIVGEITGLEPEFCADEVPTLTVRGYDLRHRLMRGRHTQTFTQMKDSDIASQIASDVGLTLEVEDTGSPIEYVMQRNQTHWEFLQSRARRLGYEVIVSNKTLLFRPYGNADSEVLTLTREDDIIEFYPRLTTMPLVGEVAVRSWNPKEKEAIVGQAGAGDESGVMGGSSSGVQTTVDRFGETQTASVVRPVFSQAEADNIALGEFQTMALAYITGEGSCVGRTDLRSGTVIQLEGFGERFSGAYYLTSTTHYYTPQRGYRTDFSVRRNAT
ncbi:MAG: phage late control D family protein [Cyanobacteria bacterium SID2]|nr:phage late control D family protein [Cyanobacteria bacterium SID2]MBP0003248.1 phage late control D family protein [Cyanobacteria bacterium SBC]